METEVIRGINMDNNAYQDGLCHRSEPILMDTYQQAVEEYLAAENAKIKQARAEAFEDSAGLKAALYKNLPSYVSVADVKEFGDLSIFEFPITITCEGNIYGFNDFGELATVLQTNIGYEDIKSMYETGQFRGYIITFSDSGLAALEVLYRGQ